MERATSVDTLSMTRSRTLTASSHGELDEFVDNLDDLSIHDSARKTGEESVFNATPPRAAISTFESDSFRPNSRNRYQLGPCVLATESQEAYDPKSLFALEKDWDFLLQIGKPEATVQPGASGRPDDNSGFLSGLDRNSGSLLQFGKPKATARRGAMGSLHDNLATNYREAYNPEFLSVLEKDMGLPTPNRETTTRINFTPRYNVDAPPPSSSTTRFNFSSCCYVGAQQRQV